MMYTVVQFWYRIVILVASGAFVDASLSEHEIAEEGAKAHRQHNPAIVCHEQQPILIRPTHQDGRQYSHDEEGVKDLHTVQSRFNHLALLLFRLSCIACPQE